MLYLPSVNRFHRSYSMKTDVEIVLVTFYHIKLNNPSNFTTSYRWEKIELAHKKQKTLTFTQSRKEEECIKLNQAIFFSSLLSIPYARFMVSINFIEFE